MIETVVGAIARPIFDKILTAGGAAGNYLKETLGEAGAKRKLKEATQKYEAQYGKRYGQIKIMPGLMKEAVPLDSIYTAIKLLGDQSKRYFLSEQDLEEAYRKEGRRSFQICSDERWDGMDIAGQTQFLMVLGGPGIGKSTFLRKIGAETLKRDGQIGRGLIPVLIELKTLKASDIDLVKIIAHEFDLCGFPAAVEFTEQALVQGKLLILLDGLDEVPSGNLNAVIECIENFVDQYDRNHFVASCRIAAYRSSFKRFTDVTIAEFDDDQIQQFIRRWFNSELDQREGTADKYWQLLGSDEHKATKELAQTPLLLTFLCLVYDREQTFPQTRSTLYGDALNILLKDWAAQKRLERDPIYQGFHPELEKELLAEIAYTSFRQNQLFFSKTDITERIAVFLADTLDAPQHLDGDAVLRAIEVQQGILVERATATYSFSHLTIQEYLTALHISNDWDALADDLIEQYACEERWREVFLLIAGLLQKGRQKTLWEKLEQMALVKATTTPKVKALVEWANRITDTNHKKLGNRAVAMEIAIGIIPSFSILVVRVRAIAKASAINVTSAIDSGSAIVSSINGAIGIAIAIENAIENAIDGTRVILSKIDKATSAVNTLIQAQTFDTQHVKLLPSKLVHLRAEISVATAPGTQWQEWANDLKLTLLDGFDLTEEMVTLSSKDGEALGDYLYITELLIQCKDAATRVPKAEWEAVEARLLTLTGAPDNPGMQENGATSLWRQSMNTVKQWLGSPSDSFWRGFGSVLDLYPSASSRSRKFQPKPTGLTKPKPLRGPSSFDADRRALASDWHAVGDDIRTSIAKVEKEQEASSDD